METFNIQKFFTTAVLSKLTSCAMVYKTGKM